MTNEYAFAQPSAAADWLSQRLSGKVGRHTSITILYEKRKTSILLQGTSRKILSERVWLRTGISTHFVDWWTTLNKSLAWEQSSHATSFIPQNVAATLQG